MSSSMSNPPPAFYSLKKITFFTVVFYEIVNPPQTLLSDGKVIMEFLFLVLSDGSRLVKATQSPHQEEAGAGCWHHV